MQKPPPKRLGSRKPDGKAGFRDGGKGAASSNHVPPKHKNPAGFAGAGGASASTSSGVGRVRISLYGMHAVCAAIRNPERRIRAIYAVEPDDPALLEALNAAFEEGIERPRVTRVEKETLHKSVPREAVHQNIGCDCTALDEVYLHDIVAGIEAKGRGVIVMLDQVTDPHNIGAILRSAAAFGADAVICQSRNAPEMNALIAKTACGGAEIVPIITETNLARAIETLQKEGFFALALDERGRMSLSDAPDYEKTLIVFGAEGAGLRPLIRDKCDLLIRLPTESSFSSLNVSNAAAITLYGVKVKAKGG